MEKVIVLLIIGLIILLLNIPLLSSQSAFFNNIYQYLVSSTGNNKDYFQVYSKYNLKLNEFKLRFAIRMSVIVTLAFFVIR